MNFNKKLAVSFVHAYDDAHSIDRKALPALWISGEASHEIYSYPFPRNVSDFDQIDFPVSGALPLQSAKNFDKLPRFGFTGLQSCNEYLYAGSWNSVYEIKKEDYSLSRIITNQMMNDMHGIWVDANHIITVLTGKDTILISSHDGEIIDYFSVGRDLKIYKDKSYEEIDWRFLSKQFRGATGIWHFNFVQKFDDEIWLTSRNLNSFIVVNLKTKKLYTSDEPQDSCSST